MPESKDTKQASPAEETAAAETSYHTMFNMEETITPAEQESMMTEGEAKARSDGWMPEGDYEGETDWVDFKEYNFRGELMGRISDQSKLIKKYERKMGKTDEAIAELKHHQGQIATIEYNKAMKDLKAMKAQAMEEGAHDAVVDIDDRMDNLKRGKAQEEQKVANEAAQDQRTQQRASAHPVVQKWMDEERNKWYHDNSEMKLLADAVASEGMADGSITTPESLVAKVEERITKVWPETYHKRSSTNTRVIEDAEPAPKRGTKSRFSQKDLSEQEKEAGKKFVKLGVFNSIQEYVDDLASHDMIEGQ